MVCTARLLLLCAYAQPSTDNNQLALLRAQADTGDAKAQYDLGMAFFLGKFGLTTNYAEAVNWLRKAADQNLAHAQYTLGNYYHDGAFYEVVFVKLQTRRCGNLPGRWIGFAINEIQ